MQKNGEKNFYFLFPQSSSIVSLKLITLSLSLSLSRTNAFEQNVQRLSHKDTLFHRNSKGHCLYLSLSLSLTDTQKMATLCDQTHLISLTLTLTLLLLFPFYFLAAAASSSTLSAKQLQSSKARKPILLIPWACVWDDGGAVAAAAADAVAALKDGNDRSLSLSIGSPANFPMTNEVDVELVFLCFLPSANTANAFVILSTSTVQTLATFTTSTPPPPFGANFIFLVGARSSQSVSEWVGPTDVDCTTPPKPKPDTFFDLGSARSFSAQVSRTQLWVGRPLLKKPGRSSWTSLSISLPHLFAFSNIPMDE